MCRYSPKDPTMVSETVHYKRGVSQQFSMPSFKIDFSEWKEEDVGLEFGTRSHFTYRCFFFNVSTASVNVQNVALQLNFDLDRGVFPMVIQAVVDEGDGGS